MSEALDYLRVFSAFPHGLWRVRGRSPLTVEAAHAVVRERLARREENFLALAEHSIYGWPRSPYLALLRSAGCELGDVQALVKQRGLEGALRALRESGVYVTFEEFKGRTPIERNGQPIPVKASDFDNGAARREFAHSSGGTSGAAVGVAMDLDFFAARAVQFIVACDAHKMAGAPIVHWRGTLPDSALREMVTAIFTGNMPRRWFSPIGWRSARGWVRYGLATWYVIAWLRLFGHHVPLPEQAPMDQALRVARFAADTARAHGRCLVRASVSRATRLGLAAGAAGLDLTGVKMMVGGEPATPAKQRPVLAAGAGFITHYGMAEAAGTGVACPHSVGDDVHLFTDTYAVFTHPYLIPGLDLTVPAFNLTTLLPLAPKVMLNVQMDDFGVVEERPCQCALGTLGMTTHLRDIRSYGKLTGEGVTLLGTDMLKILDEDLPARFGGGPLDYQLSEQEDEQGLTRLVLNIHPDVPIAAEGEVVSYLLGALRRFSSASDAARTVWESADSIQIRRAPPVWSERGKLNPLHLRRSRQNATS